FSGCFFLEKVALKSTQNILDSQYQSFLSEEDSLLAREAAAGNIKMIDGLLLKSPNDANLQLLSSKACFSYAFGYIEPENEQRASNFYLRGLNRAASKMGGDKIFFDMKFPEFEKKCIKDMPKLLEHYFWGVLNFSCWVNLNKSDINALNNRNKIELTGNEIIKNNESYYYGGGHLILGLYYSSLPVSLGGKPALAKAHFEKCLEINKRMFLPALYFYARYYAVNFQDKELFLSLLSEIESFDLNKFHEQRLSNAIIKERAMVLKREADNYFV
ncbi:MAG: hypothetical protein ACD_79C01327G0003, partial [uncultured bacterium]